MNTVFPPLSLRATALVIFPVVSVVMASTVPPLISKAEPSISLAPAVNFPPKVKALMFVEVNVAIPDITVLSSPTMFPFALKLPLAVT